MDEEEYQEYLDTIDALDDGCGFLDPIEEILTIQLRDEAGIVIPGCYRVIPARSAE